MCAEARHVARLVDFFEDDDHYYLVTKHFEDGSLRDFAKRMGRHKATFDEAKAAKVIRKVALGLKGLH